MTIPDFLLAAAVFVLAMVALGLVRILRGPTDADRMMATQLFGTGGIAALLLLGVATEANAVLDVALTLALLAANGVEPTVVEYLKTPPSKAELVVMLDLLGLEPRQLMRTKEAEYTEQGLADASLSRDQLIDAMLKTPKLIERPIVIANGRAAIGRPPENVLAVLK